MSVLVQICSSAENKSEFIVNGQQTKELECPYIVSLEINSRHSCGGTIIKTNKILTAGHCCSSNKDMKVRVGSDMVEEGGKLMEVEKIAVHKFFNKTSLEFDACVITLKHSIDIDNKSTKIAKLNNQDLQANDKVVLYGFGNVNSTHTSNYLLKFYTKTISKDDCKQQMMHPVTNETLITENMLCVEMKDGNGR